MFIDHYVPMGCSAGYETWDKLQRMNETEWLTATYPRQVLEFLRGKASNRKLRLFVLACCLEVRHKMEDPRSLAAVTFTERLTIEEPSGPWPPYRQELRDIVHQPQISELGRGDYNRAYGAARATSYACDPDAWAVAIGAEGSSFIALVDGNYVDRYDLMGIGKCTEVVRCTIIRDIFGNPFRPVALGPSWLTSTVLVLAEGI